MEEKYPKAGRNIHRIYPLKPEYPQNPSFVSPYEKIRLRFRKFMA
jgi:hypothetical protein